MKEIYLDCAATTRVSDVVQRTIAIAMCDDWYNPSSLYSPGFRESVKIKEAREEVANSINANSDEIIFTSSGSEANNLAIKGYLAEHKDTYIYITPVEHKSVILCAETSETFSYIELDENGFVDTDKLIKQLAGTPHMPKIVSVQMVNNETGIIQPVSKIAEIVHSYHGVLHVDAVQAYPHMKIDVKKYGIDMMSVSGHKFGCPKGIGFLYKNKDIQIKPLINGSQENGMRGGTENIPYILGMSAAVTIRNRSISHGMISEIYDLRTRFEECLERIGCRINFRGRAAIPTIISCTLPEGCIGEYVIGALGLRNIYISAGSACNRGARSYVLKELGFSDDEIQRTIRISFDHSLEYGQIKVVCENIAEIISSNMKTK